MKPNFFGALIVFTITQFSALVPREALAQDEELVLDTPRDTGEGGLPEQPQHSVAYVNVSSVRLNPTGLINLAEIVYRYRLFRSKRDVFKQNYVALGPVAVITPAFGKIGAAFVVQPLTILQLYSHYKFTRYFGTTGLMASFASADEDFSDKTLDERAEFEATAPYSTGGQEATLGGMLRLKLGKVLIREHFRAMYMDYNLRDGDVVFYEQLLDIMKPNHGWSVANVFDLGWVSDLGLVGGLRYSFLIPFYQDKHFAGNEVPDNAPSNIVQRLGGFAAYMLSQKNAGMMQTPTIFVSSMWHLQHRYRAGAVVSAAIPQVTLAFQFKGNFLSSD